MKSIFFNRHLHRILASLLIVSCIFGNLFPFLNIDLKLLIITPMRLSGFLVACYCAVVWLIRFVERKDSHIISTYKMRIFVSVFLFLWSVYGVAWLLFGNCVDLATTEVMAIITLFLYAFSFFTLIKESKDVMMCLNLFVGSGVVLAIMADIEVVVGSFLETSAYYYTLEQKIALSQTLFPPSTIFTNTNDLSTFLLMCLAIMGYRFLKASTAKEYIVCGVITFILLSPTPISNSTIFYIAFLLLLIIVLFFALLLHTNVKIKLKRTIQIIFSGLIYLFPFNYLIKFAGLKLNSMYFSAKIEEYFKTHTIDPNIPFVPPNEQNANALNDSLMSQLAADQAGYGTIHIRSWLIRAGFDFFAQNPLLGCGPAGFRKMMEQNPAYLEQTRSIVDPHNFYIELLSQYGIAFFAAYIGFVIYMFVKSIKQIFHEMRAGMPGRGVLVFLILTAFLFAGIIPSGFIRFIPVWIPFFLCVITSETSE